MSSMHLQNTLDREDGNFLRLYRMVARGSTRSLINPSLIDALSDIDESMLKNPHAERDSALADFALSISCFKESVITNQCTSKQDVMKKAKEFSSLMERKLRSISNRFNASTSELEEMVAEVNVSFEKYLTDDFEAAGIRGYQERLMHRKFKDAWKQTPKS
nr:uncharacterized protein LOC113820828 [Penaeus vannamei]XP_027229004.1 uncharacterized protein LOC113820828 [Penaeus vannamei]